MDLVGSNLAYGTERVDMSGKRWTLPAVEQGEPFPRGVAGMIPVVTCRKAGAEKVAYAFALDDGEADQSERPGYAGLAAAVELANQILRQAQDLSGRPFGYIETVPIAIAAKGTGYTRVQIVDRDAHGQPTDAPLHLHLETSDEPGSPYSLSVVVEYADGAPVRMALTEYGEDGYECRVSVSTNPKTGKFSVAKVEDTSWHGEKRGRLLYKRGHVYESQDRRPRRW
jgi:hypothetical protein